MPSELGVGEIRNANSGKCLDVKRGSSRDGAAIVQLACNDANHQRWRLRRDAEPDRWQIVAEHAGKCLAVQRGRGTRLEQRGCDGSARQRFELERIGNTFRLRPDEGAGCVQVEDRSLSDGARVRQAPCPEPGRAESPSCATGGWVAATCERWKQT